MIARFFRRLAKRKSLERDLEEELRFHLDQQAEVHGAGAARRRFGNSGLVQDALHDLWSFTYIEGWLQDLRYGLRKLASAPGLTVLAVLALGLGIGANTAMFSIIRGALTWNMGLDDAGRIVFVDPSEDAATTNSGASYRVFEEFRSRTQSLAGLAAYRFTPVNVSDDTGLPERLHCVALSANGFATAGIRPALGRDFTASDERAGAEPVVILSHAVWQERYGTTPQILGKVVRVDEVPRVVIGVMPPDRRFPEEADLWIPLPVSDKRDERGLMLFGRLPGTGSSGSSLQAARAEMDILAKTLAGENPAIHRGLSVRVMPIEQITGVYVMRPLFGVLYAAVGFVLLIACVDVANMLLARGAERGREVAIRMAIGAGKHRIVRQLLIESVLLALGGGLLGALVAQGGLRWFDSGTGALAAKPVWLHLELDSTAFAYLTLISFACGILFGMAPALRLTRSSVNEVLLDGGGGSAGGRFGLRLSRYLVAFEMVLCVVLLSGAGLMVRSAINLYGTPIGARTDDVLTARVSLPEAKYRNGNDRVAFHRTAAAAINALPGVSATAAVSNPPWNGWRTFAGQVQGDTAQRELDAIVATAAYFQVLDIKPTQGRLYDEGSSDAVVVNEAFAARYWPDGESPIGKSVRIGSTWMTVCGVIPTVLQDFRNPVERHPLVYIPFAAQPDARMYLLIRTAVPAASLATPVREQIRRMDENLALYEIRTLENRLAENRLSTKMFGIMMTVFGCVALVLAAIGLYSVNAHAVSLRTREIGLRMALGGDSRDILSLVIRQGIRPLAIGLLIGLPLAAAAMQAMRRALVGVSPSDPVTLVSVVLILAVAGGIGCAVPALRAAKVDPIETLRQQ